METPTRDQAIGEAVATLRGDRSQQWVADAMREAGFRWAQATVWNVEKGERPLRLAEAEALSRILDVEVTDLLRTPMIRRFFDAYAETQEAENRMVREAMRLEVALGVLAQVTDELELDEGSRISQLGASFRFDASPIDRLSARWRHVRRGNPDTGPATAEYLGVQRGDEADV